MGSRSVYLGVATRLRVGEPLPRNDFLHSPKAISLRYDVVEIENIYAARLAHGTMVASLYGNPRADVNSGGDHVSRLYKESLSLMPYMDESRGAGRGSTRSDEDDTEALIREWEKMNAEYEAANGNSGGTESTGGDSNAG